MSANTLPLPIGRVFRPSTFETGSSLVKALVNNLGYIYTHQGALYRLVKAAANLATPARAAVVTALSSGKPTWVVNTTTTANAATAVGIIPANQEPILQDDLFLVQVSGAAEAIAAAAVAANAPIGTSTTAGRTDDLSVTAGVGAMGVALAGATNAGDVYPVLLKGLV